MIVAKFDPASLTLRPPYIWEHQVVELLTDQGQGISSNCALQGLRGQPYDRKQKNLRKSRKPGWVPGRATLREGSKGNKVSRPNDIHDFTCAAALVSTKLNAPPGQAAFSTRRSADAQGDLSV